MYNKVNIKTPEQVLEEMRERFEEIKVKWSEHLSGKEKIALFDLYKQENPQVDEQIEQVLVWMNEALNENKIEGWRKFYKEWNGTDDLSRDKYDGKKDLYGCLADLQDFLIEWERATFWKEQQLLIELSQAKIINECGEKAWEELKAQVEVLKN